jgi:hypothetical protein
VIASIMGAPDDGRDSNLVKWRLSDERVDSCDSTLAWNGWVLGDFKRNPVVLLAHDSYVDKSLPIGEDVGVYMDPTEKALMGITRFVSQEIAGKDSLEARAVRWVLAGFLRAVSVGFEPIEWKVAEDRDNGESWWVPIDFVKQTLREYSVTPVPATPNALADGRGFAGMKPEEVERFAQDIELALDGAGWLALPRATLEEMRRGARGTRVQVDIAGSSFVVARAEDMPTDQGDPGDVDGDGEEQMKCPACGYSGPESDFVMATADRTAPAAAAVDDARLATMAALPSDLLVAELHRRHRAAKPAPASIGTLDAASEPGHAVAENVRVAQVVTAAMEAMDAQVAGRLPE